MLFLQYAKKRPYATISAENSVTDSHGLSSVAIDWFIHLMKISDY